VSEPPAELDGARVLCWAWSGQEPFGVVKYTTGEIAAAIYGLAICSYGDECVYRFSCDAAWGVEQDGAYESVEEAKRLLPEQYRDVPVVWKNYGAEQSGL
jgi:hypothetical protein